MNDANRAQTPPPFRTADQPSKKNKGCLFWGCLTAGIAVTLVIGLVIGGTYYVKQKIRSFTDDHPAQIPIAAVSPREKQTLSARVKKIQAAMKRGIRRRFEFSADDLNKLIAISNQTQLRGKVFIHIDGDQITADASVPLNQFPGFQGRYLNGRITLDVRVHNGRLEVFPVKIVVKGKSLPENFMAKLKAKNLAEKYDADPNARSVLEKIDSLEVKNGKIVITTRGNAP